jgi:hypothetical protein
MKRYEQEVRDAHKYSQPDPEKPHNEWPIDDVATTIDRMSKCKIKGKAKPSERNR